VAAVSRKETGRPRCVRDQRTRRTAAKDDGGGNSSISDLDTICNLGAVLANRLATHAWITDDATWARLATDALTLAEDAHALQASYAAALDCERGV
jgi:hypothetical protein